ncbi:MAG: GNAT family N-acetyltransferase, partial [Deltaproteobacteria bacterium]
MTDIDIKIGPATRADLDQIAAWCGETFDSHAAVLPFAFADRDKFLTGLAAQRDRLLMDRERARLFVARAGDELIGYVHLQPRRVYPKTVTLDDREVSIDDIFVRADWRGKGVGRRLLDTALAAAKTYRTTLISAHVWRDNAASLALFTAAPFAETVRVFEATSPDHIAREDDAANQPA